MTRRLNRRRRGQQQRRRYPANDPGRHDPATPPRPGDPRAEVPDVLRGRVRREQAGPGDE